MTNIHITKTTLRNTILQVGKHNIPKGKMHTTCRLRLLSVHITTRIQHRNNIRKTNSCAPSLIQHYVLKSPLTYTLHTQTNYMEGTPKQTFNLFTRNHKQLGFEGLEFILLLCEISIYCAKIRNFVRLWERAHLVKSG